MQLEIIGLIPSKSIHKYILGKILIYKLFYGLIYFATHSFSERANILKPYLTMNNFRLIGATTFDEYQKIMLDRAFERRFNIFKLSEPTREILINIIKAQFPVLHNITSDEIYNNIFEFLSKFQHRNYPDKLLDFFDLWYSYNITENKHVAINDIKDIFCLCSL